jgi:hypothetical protein
MSHKFTVYAYRYFELWVSVNVHISVLSQCPFFFFLTLKGYPVNGPRDLICWPYSLLSSFHFGIQVSDPHMSRSGCYFAKVNVTNS